MHLDLSKIFFQLHFRFCCKLLWFVLDMQIEYVGSHFAGDSSSGWAVPELQGGNVTF